MFITHYDISKKRHIHTSVDDDEVIVKKENVKPNFEILDSTITDEVKRIHRRRMMRKQKEKRGQQESDEEEEVVVKKPVKKREKVEEIEVVEETYPEEILEEEVVSETKQLTANQISSRLSLLGKIAEGDGYAYLKMNCSGLGLTDVLAITAFKHLQFVDVSRNKLDLNALKPITDLPYLVLLHADQNLLSSGALNKCKYLQVLIMNENQITTVYDIYQPELSTLEVGNNKIHNMQFMNRMPHLRCLDFRYNIITDLKDLNFPNLDSLYLAGNKIKSLEGVGHLVNLRILHLRFNPIKQLDGFESGLAKLQYINLRNCKIKSLKQIKKLKILPSLETLVIKGCPYMGGTGEEPETAEEEEDHSVRVEVLATLPKLNRLNKGVVNSEERIEAKELMMQWIEEGDVEHEEEEEEEEQLGEVEEEITPVE